MLYQLSYLGILRGPEGQGAPVYRQAGGPCPPGFACGYGRARPGFPSHLAPNYLAEIIVFCYSASSGSAVGGRE